MAGKPHQWLGGAALLVLLAACGAPQEAGREGRRGPLAGETAPRPGTVRAPASFAPIVERVHPAVVSIDTLAVGDALAQGPVPPGLQIAPVRRGAGSGFVISANGYVVTNNHVVEGAQEIVVSLADGRQFPARLLGRDPPTDLAVLKIEAGDLPFVSFARSALPQVGDWVVAVGNPFGLGGTATAGIVSAQGREIGDAYVSFMQIDAPMNSGNSGGPSFDLQGRVVGVNTAIFSPTGGSVGIGFAIPADLAEKVTRELIESGRVTRGYLGVEVQDLTPAIALQLGLRGRRGALIVGVGRGGPADGALRPGDVVVAVDGEEITGAGELMRRVAATRPGDRLSLRALRDGRPLDAAVRVARRPEDLA